MLGLNDLPPELLEIVFSSLPLQTLLGTCSRVCSSWHSVISHDKFLHWRKLYNKYKIDQDNYSSDHNPSSIIENSLEDLEMESAVSKERLKETPLLWLVVYSQHLYKHKPHLFTRIQTMERYKACAKNLTLSVPCEAPSDVMVTTLMILTSNSVLGVRNIAKTLVSSSSKATTADITEYLYMLSTFLLHFQRLGMVRDRLHFNVFHALYFIENEWSVTPTPANNNVLRTESKKGLGQQSLMSFGFQKTVPSKVPTAEQMKIIQHPLTAGGKDLLKIVAFAGTGKTTTLVKLTKQNPQLKFLLVVYNKSVRIQAEQQFPKSNVVCKTVHQMAMAKCGFMFGKKMTSNLKAKDILDSELLVERGEEDTGLSRRAGQVLATLNSYMNSADTELTLEHVPSVWTVGNTEMALSSLDRQIVLEDTVTVWRVMTDKEDSRLRMPHDGYLKLWQLRSPNLQWVTPHDVLLLDEGQDMNPTMLDIFMKQSVTRVIVGDPHQQIYMFRGAVNALDLVTPTHTYYLTQSFRFGPEIAFVANQCLSRLKGIDTRTLVGGLKRDSFHGTNIDPKDQVAFICRTNFGLFDKLNNLIFNDKCKDVGLVGGADGYNFDDYLDIYHLMKGQNDKMKKYKNWKSYAQFSAFAKNVADVELLSKIKIVERFGNRMPAIIDKVKTVVVKDIRKADFVLSTIHKAKGLEFDTVVLLNDSDLGEVYGPGNGRGWPEDEKNLLYVAITRAKNNLIVNENVKNEILKYNSRQTIVFSTDEDATVERKCLLSQENLVKFCLYNERNGYAYDIFDCSDVPAGLGKLNIRMIDFMLSSECIISPATNGKSSLTSGKVEDFSPKLKHPHYCTNHLSVMAQEFSCFINFPEQEKRGKKRKRD